MRRLIASLTLALMLVVGLAAPALAGNLEEEVSVTATPTFISIQNTPEEFDFETVKEGIDEVTGTSAFSVDNTSSVNIDVTISVDTATWSSAGVAWAHSDTATPEEDQAGLKASAGTGAYDVIVKYAATHNKLVTNQTGDFTWELKLIAPTSFTDGVEKEIIVRLTAAEYVPE